MTVHNPTPEDFARMRADRDALLADKAEMAAALKELRAACARASEALKCDEARPFPAVAPCDGCDCFSCVAARSLRSALNAEPPAVSPLSIAADALAEVERDATWNDDDTSASLRHRLDQLSEYARAALALIEKA